LFLKGS